jgi:hypothetical protein
VGALASGVSQRANLSKGLGRELEDNSESRAEILTAPPGALSDFAPNRSQVAHLKWADWQRIKLCSAI